MNFSGLPLPGAASKQRRSDQRSLDLTAEAQEDIRSRDSAWIAASFSDRVDLGAGRV
jgi:hypothetical protein